MFNATIGCLVASHYCLLQKATPAGYINLGDVIEVSPFYEEAVFHVRSGQLGVHVSVTRMTQAEEATQLLHKCQLNQ